MAYVDDAPEHFRFLCLTILANLATLEFQW